MLALRDYYQDSARSLSTVDLTVQRSESPTSFEPDPADPRVYREHGTVPPTSRHFATDLDVIHNIPHAIIPTADTWTLKYLRVDRLRFIQDAIDTDASGFITVNEVNIFTQSRPNDWR